MSGLSKTAYLGDSGSGGDSVGAIKWFPSTEIPGPGYSIADGGDLIPKVNQSLITKGAIIPGAWSKFGETGAAYVGDPTLWPLNGRAGILAGPVWAQFTNIADNAIYLRLMKYNTTETATNSYIDNGKPYSMSFANGKIIIVSNTNNKIYEVPPSYKEITSTAYVTTWSLAKKIAYGAGIYVGFSGTEIRSSAGAWNDWIIRTIPSRVGNFIELIWDGVQFVLASDAGEVWISSDGVNWFKLPSLTPPSGAWQWFCFDGVSNYVFASTNYLYTCSDIVTGGWAVKANPPAPFSSYARVSAGGGVIMAATMFSGSANKSAWLSTDNAATWIDFMAQVPVAAIGTTPPTWVELSHGYGIILLYGSGINYRLGIELTCAKPSLLPKVKNGVVYTPYCKIS